MFPPRPVGGEGETRGPQERPKSLQKTPRRSKTIQECPKRRRKKAAKMLEIAEIAFSFRQLSHDEAQRPCIEPQNDKRRAAGGDPPWGSKTPARPEGGGKRHVGPELSLLQTIHDEELGVTCWLFSVSGLYYSHKLRSPSEVEVANRHIFGHVWHFSPPLYSPKSSTQSAGPPPKARKPTFLDGQNFDHFWTPILDRFWVVLKCNLAFIFGTFAGQVGPSAAQNASLKAYLHQKREFSPNTTPANIGTQI